MLKMLKIRTRYDLCVENTTSKECQEMYMYDSALYEYSSVSRMNTVGRYYQDMLEVVSCIYVDATFVRFTNVLCRMGSRVYVFAWSEKKNQGLSRSTYLCSPRNVSCDVMQGTFADHMRRRMYKEMRRCSHGNFPLPNPSD